MRAIKFRGKSRYTTHDWLYGNLMEICDRYFIKPKTNKQPQTIECEVITETVGQFTGRLDKNGVEIYEGDIINFTRWVGNWQSCDRTHKQLTTKHTIVWDNGVSRFGLTESYSDTMKFREHPQYIYEVIGNIFDTDCAFS